MNSAHDGLPDGGPTRLRAVERPEWPEGGRVRLRGGGVAGGRSRFFVVPVPGDGPPVLLTWGERIGNRVGEVGTVTYRYGLTGTPTAGAVIPRVVFADGVWRPVHPDWLEPATGGEGRG